MPFNLVKLELQYCNLFQNGSATKEIGLQKNANFATLIGCHGKGSQSGILVN